MSITPTGYGCSDMAQEGHIFRKRGGVRNPNAVFKGLFVHKLKISSPLIDVRGGSIDCFQVPNSELRNSGAPV
jgi:hypothetical protein